LKKRGARKGVRTPHYPEEIKIQAKELYLRGWNTGEIARMVKEWTGRGATPRLIGLWIEQRGWDKERAAFLESFSKKLTTKTETQMLERAEEQLDAYKQMISMGLKAIKDKSVTVDKASEIVDLIDKGIRGERQVSAGLVSWKYIEKVVSIISEEIEDDEIKKRIASRLQKATVELLHA